MEPNITPKIKWDETLNLVTLLKYELSCLSKHPRGCWY